MKLLTGLPLDQIGHPPSGPQPRAITQRLGAFLQSSAQLLQLDRLQPGFAARSARLLKCLDSLLVPSVIPAADGLPVNVQPSGDLRLAQALTEEPGCLEPPLFELVKIAFDAFGVTHAQKVSQGSTSVTILCEIQ